MQSKWSLLYTRQAKKDAKNIKQEGLRESVEFLLNILMKDPLQSPPPFETLKGKLKGAYSRRISYQHRLVYEILGPEKIIKVLRMWTHYE